MTRTQAFIVGIIIFWIIIAAGSLFFTIPAANAQTRAAWIAGLAGHLFSFNPSGYRNHEVDVRVFRDTNGCEYLIATSGTYYSDDGAPSVSMTPRIGTDGKPFCRK